MNHLEQAVKTACLWEARARKAGNVHPGASFADLSFADFEQSAEAISPVLQEMANESLGCTILAAVEATRTVVATNTNLGIILLLTPLTKVPACSEWSNGIRRVLDTSTIDDAKKVYRAIRRAMPGGLGKVDAQDVREEPTATLREVMALAADRDSIARQYSTGFSEVLDGGVPALLEGWRRFGSVEAAILTCQLHWLTQIPDSLIQRKRGREAAEEVRRRARRIELTTREGRELYRAFDRWLREDGHARNPGTTADLTAACLFVTLSDGRMDASMPFDFQELQAADQ